MPKSDTHVDLEMHDRIKRELRARNVTFASLASATGYSASLITMVSQGYRENTRIRQLIAKKIGVPADELWQRRGSAATEEENMQ